MIESDRGKVDKWTIGGGMVFTFLNAGGLSLWNGPMGIFESSRLAKSVHGISECVCGAHQEEGALSALVAAMLCPRWTSRGSQPSCRTSPRAAAPASSSWKGAVQPSAAAIGDVGATH